jgi:hypothetical protein
LTASALPYDIRRPRWTRTATPCDSGSLGDPPVTAAALLSLAAAAGRHPISPLIYGLNAPPDAVAAQARAGLLRHSDTSATFSRCGSAG